MEYMTIVEKTRQFLKEGYSPFIQNGYIDRLVLTERRELQQNIQGINKDELNTALERMYKDGYIQEDNGILITFKLSFIL
jgi:hypothetical protein